MIKDSMGKVVEGSRVMTKSDKCILVCDFCEAVTDLDIDKLTGLGWTSGVRGYTTPMGNICGMNTGQVKHACPKDLCQAKLLVWART